jgi:hypothetical protein
MEGLELAQQGAWAWATTVLTKAGSDAAWLLWEKPISDAAEQHNQRRCCSHFFLIKVEKLSRTKPGLVKQKTFGDLGPGLKLATLDGVCYAIKRPLPSQR